MPKTRGMHWWNEDGTGFYTAHLLPNPDPNAKEKKIVEYSEWNGETGIQTPLSARPSFKGDTTLVPRPLPISLVWGATAALPARETNVSPDMLRPLYLEARDTAPTAPLRAALLTPHATKSWILPDMSAALYETDGALYVVPLVRMKATAFADVQKAAQRQEVMLRGKQAGTAILMYAQHYDETLPPQAGFAEAIKPYLTNAEILNGFTYVGGGPLAKIEFPATTVVGYIAAPGGRAIVYVDGHVKWENQE